MREHGHVSAIVAGLSIHGMVLLAWGLHDGRDGCRGRLFNEGALARGSLPRSGLCDYSTPPFTTVP